MHRSILSFNITDNMTTTASDLLKKIQSRFSTKSGVEHFIKPTLLFTLLR